MYLTKPIKYIKKTTLCIPSSTVLRHHGRRQPRMASFFLAWKIKTSCFRECRTPTSCGMGSTRTFHGYPLNELPISQPATTTGVKNICEPMPKDNDKYVDTTTVAIHIYTSNMAANRHCAQGDRPRALFPVSVQVLAREVVEPRTLVAGTKYVCTKFDATFRIPECVRSI